MSEKLAQFGITQADIFRRPVVATGVCEAELLPPYLNASHELRAKQIWRRLNSAKLSILVLDQEKISTIGKIQALKAYKVIEVAGSFSIACVPEAVDVLTKNGFFVYVDATKLVGSYPNPSDEELIEDVVKHAKESEATFIEPIIALFRRRVQAPQRRV